MADWRTINRTLYTILERARARRDARAAVRISAGAPGSVPGSGEDLLFVSWGRIGDAILTTGLVSTLRAAVHARGGRLTVLGRAETSPVLRPFADRFLAWPGGADTPIWSSLADNLGGFGTIVSDLHLFYGGLRRVGGFLAGLPAERRFVYAGYFQGADLVPIPVEPPAGFEVIETMPGGGAVVPGAPPSSRHLLHHALHYARALHEHAGLFPAAPTAESLRPRLHLANELPDGLLRSYGIRTSAYIAVQIFANNPKKEWPLARWEELFDAHPDQTFLALGSERDARRLAKSSIAVPNLVSLCGRLSLNESLRLIQHARAFVGVDSGLTHAATALGTQSVCVAQDANLGWFFPYPSGFDNLRTISNPEFAACAGCFSVCRHESILATRLRGAKCLRELGSAAVCAALEDAIASAIAARADQRARASTSPASAPVASPSSSARVPLTTT